MPIIPFPTDVRPRVPLDGTRVNVAQLTAELGGAGLCVSETEVVAAEGAQITQAQLAAAVATHVADPNYGRPAEDITLDGMRAKALNVLSQGGAFNPTEMQRILAALVARLTR